jgi:branched-chain amino acid transport system ATP-binding protein
VSRLELAGVTAGYATAVVLHDVDLVVDEGDVVALVGANGAGKTTLLRAISRLTWSRGSIRVGAEEIVRLAPAAVAALGVGHVPEGRGTFRSLTVRDNLMLGAYRRRDRAAVRAELSMWLDLFPNLAGRLRQPAGLLSGGEQQMLAIARALMARPRTLLLDEPSSGLAPALIDSVFGALADIHRRFGMTMLIVEQNVAAVANLASRAAVIETGRVVAEAPAGELLNDRTLHAAYLGG